MTTIFEEIEERIEELKEQLKSQPYHSSFKRNQLDTLEWVLKQNSRRRKND